MLETLDAIALDDDVPWWSKFKQSFSSPFNKFGGIKMNKYRAMFKPNKEKD